MKTCIISTFPACGVTHLCEHGMGIPINAQGDVRIIKAIEAKMLDYRGTDAQVSDFVNQVVNSRGTVDFIFIPFYEEVLAELNKRGIPFVVVMPDNLNWHTDRDRQIVKQQWLGRMLLSGHSAEFIKNMMDSYDILTSSKRFMQYNPAMYFTLKENQYIRDILEYIFIRKEAYPEVYVNDK